MSIFSDIKWNQLFYDGGELLYEGFVRLHPDLKYYIPRGQGTKYFKNGQKWMEGRFNGMSIESGIEYYGNGNIRFIGEYNQGDMGLSHRPRFFVFGRLFYETGQLWYEGELSINLYNEIGWRQPLGDDSFKRGTEYNEDGSVKKIHAAAY